MLATHGRLVCLQMGLRADKMCLRHPDWKRLLLTGACMLQVAILESCRDRNIVQFLGSCTDSAQTLLVTESVAPVHLPYTIDRCCVYWTTYILVRRRQAGLKRQLFLHGSRTAGNRNQIVRLQLLHLRSCLTAGSWRQETCTAHCGTTARVSFSGTSGASLRGTIGGPQ